MRTMILCAVIALGLACAPALAKEEAPENTGASDTAQAQGAAPQEIDYTRPYKFDGLRFPEPDLETIFDRSRRRLESANPQFLIPEIVEPETPAPTSE